VYFFEKEDMEGILLRPPRGDQGGEMFGIDQLSEDRRMVSAAPRASMSNFGIIPRYPEYRKERKKMYRIWLQVKARKLAAEERDGDEGVS